MRFVSALLAVAASFVTTALAIEIKHAGFKPGGIPNLSCSIRVDFGSHCCGPNQADWMAVKTYIEGSSAIAAAESWGWGKEGDFTLCLTVSGADDTKRVYQELNAIPFNKDDRHGWTRVQLGNQ